MYPPEGGFGGDRAESVAGSMVDSSVANEIDSERFSSNTMLCIKLFVSGLPAFLACIIGPRPQAKETRRFLKHDHNC